MKLHVEEIFRKAEEHLHMITKSGMTHSEMRDIIETITHYRRRRNNLKGIEIANQYPAEARPVTLDDRDK